MYVHLLCTLFGLILRCLTLKLSVYCSCLQIPTPLVNVESVHTIGVEFAMKNVTVGDKKTQIQVREARESLKRTGRFQIKGLRAETLLTSLLLPPSK